MRVFLVNPASANGATGRRWAKLERRAAALGLEGEIGTLEPGKWGDCAVVRPRSAGGGPAEQVLETRREDVIATFVGGRSVYRADPVRT